MKYVILLLLSLLLSFPVSLSAKCKGSQVRVTVEGGQTEVFQCESESDIDIDQACSYQQVSLGSSASCPPETSYQWYYSNNGIGTFTGPCDTYPSTRGPAGTYRYAHPTNPKVATISGGATPDAWVRIEVESNKPFAGNHDFIPHRDQYYYGEIINYFVNPGPMFLFNYLAIQSADPANPGLYMKQESEQGYINAAYFANQGTVADYYDQPVKVWIDYRLAGPILTLETGPENPSGEPRVEWQFEENGVSTPYSTAHHLKVTNRTGETMHIDEIVYSFIGHSEGSGSKINVALFDDPQCSGQPDQLTLLDWKRVGSGYIPFLPDKQLQWLESTCLLLAYSWVDPLDPPTERYLGASFYPQGGLQYSLDSAYVPEEDVLIQGPEYITGRFRMPADFDIVINSEGDAPDLDPADGLCNTGGSVDVEGTRYPECTLRAALQTAQASPGDHAIGFHYSVKTINITSSLPAVTDGGDIIIDGRADHHAKIQILGNYQNCVNGLTFGSNVETVSVESIYLWGFPENGILSTAAENWLVDVTAHTCGGYGISIEAPAQRADMQNVVAKMNGRGGIYSLPGLGSNSYHITAYKNGIQGGIVLGKSSVLDFGNISATDNRGDGIRVDGDLTITKGGNTFLRNDGNGISATGNVTLDGVSAAFNKKRGIEGVKVTLQDSDFVSTDESHALIYENQEEGIYCHELEAKNGRIYNNGKDGVRATRLGEGGGAVTLNNVTVEYNTGNGVIAGGSVTLNASRVESNDGHGIRTSGSRVVVQEKSRVSYNHGSGIYATGGWVPGGNGILLQDAEVNSNEQSGIVSHYSIERGSNNFLVNDNHRIGIALFSPNLDTTTEFYQFAAEDFAISGNGEHGLSIEGMTGDIWPVNGEFISNGGHGIAIGVETPGKSGHFHGVDCKIQNNQQSGIYYNGSANTAPEETVSLGSSSVCGNWQEQLTVIDAKTSLLDTAVDQYCPLKTRSPVPILSGPLLLLLDSDLEQGMIISKTQVGGKQ